MCGWVRVHGCMCRCVRVHWCTCCVCIFVSVHLGYMYINEYCIPFIPTVDRTRTTLLKLTWNYNKGRRQTMHLVTSLLVARCLALVTLSPPHVSADCVAVFSGQEKPCTSKCVVPSSPSQLPTCSTHKNGNSQYGPCSSDCDSNYCSEECQLRIAQVSGGASQTTTAAGNDASTAVAGFSTTLSTMPGRIITTIHASFFYLFVIIIIIYLFLCVCLYF